MEPEQISEEDDGSTNDNGGGTRGHARVKRRRVVGVAGEVGGAWVVRWRCGFGDSPDRARRF
jgi:hypothetical protein